MGAVALMSVIRVSLLTLLMGLVITSTIDWNNGKVPFTLQEWMWATQGGYLHTMIDYYIRNGGL